MKNAVPLIIFLIVVGGIVAWGFMTDWTFSGLIPRKGAKCTPDEDSKDENATEYIYNTDKECLIVKKCKEGWEPNSSNSACIYSSSGTECTPTGTVVTNGRYTFDDAGACNLTSCLNNFKLEANACDKCKNGYMLSGDECVDPGLTISDSKQTNLGDYSGVIFLDKHDVTCDGTGALNQFVFKDDGVHPNPNIQGWTYYYDYKCIENIPGFELGNEQNTGAVNHGQSRSTSYLTNDDINVDCGNKPIGRFKLYRPDNNVQIAYKYSCGNNTVNSSTCQDKQSTAISDVDDNRALIDNEVACDGKGVITQFKLDKGDDGKFYYKYKCCDLY